MCQRRDSLTAFSDAVMIISRSTEREGRRIHTASVNITEYCALEREGIYEETIQKSRFIGYASPALEEKDALAYLDRIHALHPDASCICHAYVSGLSGAVQRFYDGHEPVGGMPILDAIRKRGVTGSVCAVVRYFGGIKLGMGGLARAFGNVAIAAVDRAHPCRYELCSVYELTFPYEIQGKLDYLLSHLPVRMGETRFSQDVSLSITVDLRREKDVLAQAENACAGALLIEKTGEVYLPRLEDDGTVTSL